MSSEQPNQPNSSNNPSTDNPTTNTDHTNNPTTGNTNNPNTDNTQPPRPRRRRVPNNDATNLANDLMSNLNGVLPQGSTARVFNSFTGMNQIFGGMMQAAGNAAPNGPNGSNGGINFGAFAPMMMQMGQNNTTNGSNDNQNSFQGGMFGFPPGMNAQMFGGMFGGNNNNNNNNTNNNDQNNTNTNNTNNANTNNTNNPNNANNPNNPFVSLGNMFQGLSGLGGINIMGMGPDGQTMNFNDLMTMMMGGAGLDRGPDPNAPASNDFIENLPLHSYSEEWYHQWVEDRVQYLMFQRQIELDEKERAGKEKEANKGEKEEDIVQDENTNNNNNNNSTTMNNDDQPLDSLTLPQPTVDNTNDNDVIDETNLFSQQPSTNEDVLLSPNDTNANQVQFNGDLAAYELQLREQLKEFECQICMIDFEKDDLITHLPCDHWYHYRCIEPWLKQRNTCPSCRSLADRGDRDRGTGNRVNGNNTATTSTTTTINGVPTTTNRPQATNGVYHLPIQPLAPAMRQQLQRSLGATDDANADNNTTSPTLSSTQPLTSPPEAPQPRPVDPNPFRTSDFEFSIESFSNPTSNTTTSPSSSTQQFYVHQYQAQEHNISQSHPNITPFEKWQPEVNTFSEFNNAKLYSSLYHD